MNKISKSVQTLFTRRIEIMNKIKQYDLVEKTAMDYFIASGGKDLNVYGMVAGARELKQKELDSIKEQENGFGT